VNVPADAPPLFIAVGSNHFNVTNGCLALFAERKKAGNRPKFTFTIRRVAASPCRSAAFRLATCPDRLIDWMQLHKLPDYPPAEGCFANQRSLHPRRRGI
jgi:hypothetical protein